MSTGSSSVIHGPDIISPVQGNGAKWLEEAFEEILRKGAQLGLYRRSPKIFVIYAHDNDQHPDFHAGQTIVKKFISWFKKLNFDVASDRSPHGFVSGRGAEISGASNNIISNQLCLLPHDWDKRNVEHNGKTYTERLIQDLEELNAKRPTFDSESVLQEAFGRIHSLREEFKEVMGNKFHHVLTELALAEYRSKLGERNNHIVPILLSGKHETSLPRFIIPSNLWLENKDEYKSMFKILLRFETLEDDRPTIEVLEVCFNKCNRLLREKSISSWADFRSRCLVIMVESLHELLRSPRYAQVERRVTKGDIQRVLTLHALLGRSSMKRLSGQKLPEDLEDIELVMLNEQEASISKSQSNPTESTVFEESQGVTVHDLFEQRQLKDKKLMLPKRILIRGNAGVGKSALSKKIMYEYSCHEKFRGMYDFIVRLPLRKLFLTTNLKQLLYNEYFNLIPQGDHLAELLCNLILEEENNSKIPLCPSSKILLILDGLDEALGWDIERHSLLLKLLNQPIVIITSRVNLDGKLNIKPVDLTVEATGLSKDSIQTYIKNVNIGSPKVISDIKSFLDTNQSLQEMLKTPILLDIFCYAGDELLRLREEVLLDKMDGMQFERLTVTDFYKAIAQKLWKKDIPQLKKRDYAEILDKEILNALTDPTRLERVVEPEMVVLGEIALTLLEHNRIDFTDRDIDKALESLESEKEKRIPLSLQKNLQKMSFLRVDHHRSGMQYNFIHLTFLEYFAAGYLAREQHLLEQTMRKHKYNPRYESVWQFTAGLLPSKRLEGFYDMLEKEPRELVGIRHLHLLALCSTECWNHLEQFRRRPLENLLSESIPLTRHIFAKRIMFGEIWNRPSFPEAILLSQMHDEEWFRIWFKQCFRKDFTDSFYIHLLDYMEAHNVFITNNFGWRFPNESLSSPRILKRLRNYLHDGREKIQFAVHCLVEYPQLEEFEVDIMMREWEDREYLFFFRRALCPMIVNRLIRILTTEHSKNAASILVDQLKLPHGIVDAIWEMRMKEKGQDFSNRIGPLERLACRADLDAQTSNEFRILLGQEPSWPESAFLVHDIVKQPVFHDDLVPHILEVFMGGDGMLVRTTLRVFSNVKWLLSPSVFRSIVKLFKEGDHDIRRCAAYAIRQQFKLDLKSFERTEINIQEASDIYPVDLAIAFEGHLDLIIDDPVGWMIQNVFGTASREKCREFSSYDEMMLPHCACPSMASNLSLIPWQHSVEAAEENEYRQEQVFKYILETMATGNKKFHGIQFLPILRQMKVLHETMVDRLIAAILQDGLFGAITALRDRPEAREKLQDALRQQGHNRTAELLCALAGADVPVDILRNLHCPYAINKRIEEILKLDYPLGYETRLWDDYIEILSLISPEESVVPDSLLIAFDARKGHGLESLLGFSDPPFQKMRSLKSIRSAAEGFENYFLGQSIEEAMPVWIANNSLYWYAADGSLEVRHIEKEKDFRKTFHKLQEEAGVPECARIKYVSRMKSLKQLSRIGNIKIPHIG